MCIGRQRALEHCAFSHSAIQPIENYPCRAFCIICKVSSEAMTLIMSVQLGQPASRWPATSCAWAIRNSSPQGHGYVYSCQLPDPSVRPPVRPRVLCQEAVRVRLAAQRTQNCTQHGTRQGSTGCTSSTSSYSRSSRSTSSYTASVSCTLSAPRCCAAAPSTSAASTATPALQHSSDPEPSSEER